MTAAEGTTNFRSAGIIFFQSRKLQLLFCVDSKFKSREACAIKFVA